jgi:hypothetical protein
VHRFRVCRVHWFCDLTYGGKIAFWADGRKTFQYTGQYFQPVALWPRAPGIYRPVEWGGQEVEKKKGLPKTFVFLANATL